MGQQAIICDASSLISLTDSGFLWVLYNFKKRNNIFFMVPQKVKYECITRPLGIKKYAMHAIRLQDAVNDEIINVADLNVEKEGIEVMEIANNIFFSKGKPIHLVDAGEAEMIALTKKLGIENLLIDERNTRMLIENPEDLKKQQERELKVSITYNKKNLEIFKNIVKNLFVFRSSEVLGIAYEKGMFNKFQGIEKQALEAGLNSLKFNGCSISFEEVGKLMYNLKNPK
ncbi:hypothetical protein KO317_02870 [Candidatus Micrarchaeota archaeon]|nr:hypothetical protein [Candidatus Micrarchaeota archaeon]